MWNFRKQWTNFCFKKKSLWKKRSNENDYRLHGLHRWQGKAKRPRTFIMQVGLWGGGTKPNYYGILSTLSDSGFSNTRYYIRLYASFCPSGFRKNFKNPFFQIFVVVRQCVHITRLYIIFCFIGSWLQKHFKTFQKRLTTGENECLFIYSAWQK